MAGANPIRGEVELKLGERTIVLKPEFARKARLEARLDKGLGEMLGVMQRRGLRNEQAAALLEEAGDVKPKDAAKLIDDHGLMSIAVAFVEFCENAVLGGVTIEEMRRRAEEAEKEAEKNAAAAATESPATAASPIENTSGNG